MSSNTHTKFGRAELNPSEWAVCGVFYQGPSEYERQSYSRDMALLNASLEAVGLGWDDVQYHRNGGCASCGTGFFHGAVVFNTRTKDAIAIGGICLDVFGCGSMVAKARKEAKKAAERGAMRRKGVAFAEAHGIIEDLKTDHYIIEDIASKLFRYGSLSPKQVDLVKKITVDEAARKVRMAEHDEKMKDTPALEEGRYTIEGVVVSTKAKDSMYGTQYKMLVEMESGNRVWGTIPRSIDDEVWGTRGTVTVRFDAAVERSQDDDHFGFFKKPTKSAVVSTKEVQPV